MKWFDKGITYYKYNLQISQTMPDDVHSLATLGEDGQIMIWDFSGKNLDRSVKNDISNCIKPLLKVEIFKVDCII